MPEEVGAFVRTEAVDELAESLPECVDGADGAAAQQRLELGESHLDRVQIGTVGRQEQQACPGRLDRFAHPATLCEPRLSMTTTSPGLSVGTSTCSMKARNDVPLMAPSNTPAAEMRSQRNAAITVEVFQWPCGTAATRRWPRGARPRSRVMLVLIQSLPPDLIRGFHR
jgi:hypothetical protein